jgi:hypothetical protein
MYGTGGISEISKIQKENSVCFLSYVEISSKGRNEGEHKWGSTWV